jgi:hypothetical protein
MGTVIDLSTLRENDFKETGIKGVRVFQPGTTQTLDEWRANAWTVEDGNLHLWKVEQSNDGKPVPVAHIGSVAASHWTRATLVSEL